MTDPIEMRDIVLMTRGGNVIVTARPGGVRSALSRGTIRASLLNLGEGSRSWSDALEITSGSQRILVVRGETLVLAATLSGPVTRSIVVNASDWLRNVEGEFGAQLEAWTGGETLADAIRPLLRRLPHSRQTLESGLGKGSLRMKTKVVLVGESGVRKTQLLRSFVLDAFDDKYIATLGTKVSKKEMTVRYPPADAEVELDMTVWDILGSAGFRDLLRDAFFYGAKGVLAVCDVRDVNTLYALDDWISAVFSTVGEVPVVLLVDRPEVANLATFGTNEVRRVAATYGAPYYFTSSTGENVEEAFHSLANLIVGDRFR